VDISSPANAEAYAAHVAACRACTRCGLTNIAGCAHPSPWAMWMGALDARVVVVGQDFSGTDQGWREPQLDLPTNVNLRHLMRTAGLGEGEVYLTNAILCLKPGGTSAPVRGAWVRNCSGLLRETIRIVAPDAVAALGAVAWRALGYVFEVRLPALGTSVGRRPVSVPGGPSLFAFNHPGGLGLVRRRLAEQSRDWQRFGRWLSAAARRRAA
jgi:uracil-DNA glycosylase family 4